jgi:hypothetical protein
MKNDEASVSRRIPLSFVRELGGSHFTFMVFVDPFGINVGEFHIQIR